MKLDSLNPWKIRERRKKSREDEEFAKTKELMEGGRDEYGFQVTFIEDNIVHVKNSTGKEVAFTCPSPGITMEKYDAFVQQMQNKNAPLPSVGSIGVMNATPLTQSEKRVEVLNSDARPISLEEAAKRYGMTEREFFNMELFARVQLYARYKARLRDKKVDSE